MSLELWALFGCTIILIISIIMQGLHLDKFAGYKYTLGNRDAGELQLSPMGRRLGANVGNQVEGLMMFSPLIVIAQFADIQSNLIAWAAVTYACSRFIYMFCYAFGVTVVRSVVWGVGVLALLAVIIGIILGV